MQDGSEDTKYPQSVKAFKKKLRAREEPAFQDDANHVAHCKGLACARCKWIRLEDKWQQKFPMLQWNVVIDEKLAPPGVRTKAHGSWLDDCFDSEGSWQGVGCIACCKAVEDEKCQGDSTAIAGKTGRTAARSFAEYKVASVDALQASNLARHAKLPHHKASVLRYLGAQVAEPSWTCGSENPELYGVPPEADFERVFKDTTSGKAPSAGIDGVASGKKIQKMVFCLFEAKSSMDREFMRVATMCTHRRDERAGRLALRCAATTDELEQRRFHMSVQTGMGTGARSITNATDKSWAEFSTRHFGAPRSKRAAEKADFDKELYEHIRMTHRQMVIDSASDEKLSGRQMEQALLDQHMYNRLGNRKH